MHSLTLMSRDAKEFEISKLLELARENKYATTVAAFEAIEMMEQIDIPKKMLNRKPAVKAMFALTEKLVQYDYIDDEARAKLEEELKGTSKVRSALDAVFAAPGSAAPAADESDEDLDEIGETAEPEAFEDADASEFHEEEEEKADDEEEEEESDDADDDADDDDEEEPVLEGDEA
ncbi:MAG: DNA primase [Spirochaetia bacterium]|nr:DNA primase [Spirochaetia bacterium]